jgi:hypothetical protein
MTLTLWVTSRHHTAAWQRLLKPPKRSFGVLRGLLDLVGHPLAEIAVFRLGLAVLHKWDAGSAVRNAVAVKNSQVHEIIAKEMGDDRSERLSAVNVSKEPIAVLARRREPHNAADSRKNLGQRSIRVRKFRMLRTWPP